MTNIFSSLFSSWGSFASSGTNFIPFLFLCPMILCVCSGIFGFLKQ